VLALTMTRLSRVFPALAPLRRYEMADLEENRERAVDQVMGAAFAIRREALVAIGPLDEGFWIWFEEVDWCRRARDAGWETRYVPSAEIFHHRASAFAQVSALTRAWWYARSALRYSRKHLSVLATVLLAAAVPVSLLTGAVATLAGATPAVRAQPRKESYL
jgi:hypothetical protein